MRLNKLLCLSVVLLATSVQAQDLKILVDDKGKVGFADQNGNEVIKCQYESVQPFSDGVAIVTKAGKSGVIDATGKVLLPLKYTQIQPWTNNLYLIKDGKVAGLADHNGTIVLPAKYSHISKPNCYGKALIALGGKATQNDKKTYMANAKYGIINAQGSVLIEPNYKGLYEFSYDGRGTFPYYEGKRLSYNYHYTTDTLLTDCSYLGYSDNGTNIYHAGIIDGNGTELLKSGLYDFVMLPQSDMVRYYITKKKQIQCGYHNLSTGKSFQAAQFGNEINNINFWSHGDFIGDIAPVNGDSWSFIDKTGKSLRTGYTSLTHCQITKLWAAKNTTGKWDVFDDSNNDIATLSGYEDIRFPINQDDKEIFSVSKNGKYGCITRSGKVVVPFEYEQAYGNFFDMIAVKKNGKWGFISTNNKHLVPMEYAGLIFPSERNAQHLWVMKSDSLYYHIDLKTNRLSSKGYKKIENFKNGIAFVIPQTMTVNDTQVNRAQMHVPNTWKATQNPLDLSKNAEAFGYFLNTNDAFVMDVPVSVVYKDAVLKEIEKLGGRIPTEMEKKNILLEVTRANRSYNLKSTLSEDEWNY